MYQGSEVKMPSLTLHDVAVFCIQCSTFMRTRIITSYTVRSSLKLSRLIIMMGLALLFSFSE